MEISSATPTVEGEVVGGIFTGGDTIKVIVGDSNLDDKVDIEDLMIVGKYYGKY